MIGHRATKSHKPTSHRQGHYCAVGGAVSRRADASDGTLCLSIPARVCARVKGNRMFRQSRQTWRSIVRCSIRAPGGRGDLISGGPGPCNRMGPHARIFFPREISFDYFFEFRLFKRAVWIGGFKFINDLRRASGPGPHAFPRNWDLFFSRLATTSVCAALKKTPRNSEWGGVGHCLWGI